ncbi:hypothetical protein [Pontibacter amylolyticus]|uniref:Uncharacterized protein n=1 Tax=Pontibacter amylolyticus TaxID=1424080 RepID=A0ABQ1WEW2_9BACT|nr:hypothetical protein [Pontibacter amylolyticus]GGG28725.1 hypothetical protein GCM10011323_35170 [Pontibacter amylolyticus]
MKFIEHIKSWTLVCLLVTSVTACTSETRHSANNEVEEFSTWVDENSRRAETATEEEWNEMEAEYNRKATEVEKRSADWDDQTKAEWEKVQAKWQETVGRSGARFRATEGEMEFDTAQDSIE